MNALTRREYWDQGYAARDERAECRFDWREYVNHLLVKKIEGLGLDGKRVLEIGAGDSAWLPYFARRYLPVSTTRRPDARGWRRGRPDSACRPP
jgi:hypothetical protein